MAEFHMQVAGVVAAVSALFQSTPGYFQKYLTQAAADFSITVTAQDLRREDEIAREEARQEGFRPRNFPEPYLERAVIQRRFAEHLFTKDILLFHGSAVAVDGRGYLFTAHSGTGKSTHTRLWCQVFGERAVMINDDKPFLQFTPEGIRVWGSPWSGKHGLDSNLCLPLDGVCLLSRGIENRIEPADPEAMLPLLLKQCGPPLDPGAPEKYLPLARQLANTTRLYRMQCNKDPAAAMVAYRAMKLP